MSTEASHNASAFRLAASLDESGDFVKLARLRTLLAGVRRIEA